MMWLKGALQWLVDEARVKKGFVLDSSEWKLVHRENNLPQQEKGYDCGVFAIMCADFLSDDLPLSYTQKDVPFFRKKMILLSSEWLHKLMNYSWISLEEL